VEQTCWLFCTPRHASFSDPAAPTSRSTARLISGRRHGDAAAKARERAMWKKGDKDGADTWLRIIVAIGTLGEPPTEARH
jgi:hypothetical protein